MAQRYFTQPSKTSSLNKNLRSVHLLCYVLFRRYCSVFVALFSTVLSLDILVQVWYAASYAEFVNQKIHNVTEEERKGEKLMV